MAGNPSSNSATANPWDTTDEISITLDPTGAIAPGWTRFSGRDNVPAASRDRTLRKSRMGKVGPTTVGGGASAWLNSAYSGQMRTFE